MRPTGVDDGVQAEHEEEVEKEDGVPWCFSSGPPASGRPMQHPASTKAYVRRGCCLCGDK